MINAILKEPALRTKVQSYNLPDIVYLIAAVILNICIATVWIFLIFKVEKSVDIFIALTGLLNGFLAYLFMHYKNKYKLIFYSVFFSVLTSMLSIYVFYMHFINWEISTVINKDKAGLQIAIQYFSYAKNGYGYLFLHYLKQTWQFFTILWLAIVLIAPFMYILFDEPEDDKDDGDIENKDVNYKSGRLIKRRFDF